MDEGVVASAVNKKDPYAAFQRDLGILINRHSMENPSATPDHILAEYLTGCLRSFDHAARSAGAWRSVESQEGAGRAKPRKPIGVVAHRIGDDNAMRRINDLERSLGEMLFLVTDGSCGLDTGSEQPSAVIARARATFVSPALREAKDFYDKNYTGN